MICLTYCCPLPMSVPLGAWVFIQSPLCSRRCHYEQGGELQVCTLRLGKPWLGLEYGLSRGQGYKAQRVISVHLLIISLDWIWNWCAVASIFLEIICLKFVLDKSMKFLFIDDVQAAWRVTFLSVTGQMLWPLGYLLLLYRLGVRITVTVRIRVGIDCNVLYYTWKTQWFM